MGRTTKPKPNGNSRLKAECSNNPEIPAEQNTFMRCLRCGVCCTETEMLLSTRDIERLEKQGYTRSFFVRFDNQGYATLKNRHGHCVFYDPEKKRCTVRTHRPAGCRIYPVIYDEDKGITVDTICPSRNTVTDKQKTKRGEKVIKLLKTIDTEAKKRRTKPPQKRNTRSLR